MTLVGNWYQHQHERIASRSLRCICVGTGGTAYASAEAIGCVIPAPPDQTYAGTILQTPGTVDFLTVNSEVHANAIMYFGIGLGLVANLGIALVADGRQYNLGYITSVQEIGGVWTRIETYVNPNVAATYTVTVPATDYIVTYSAAIIPTPNVFIGYPAMVNVEYSPIIGADPRQIAPVKVFRRNSAYMGGVAGFISLDTGIELPAILEPGWYAFVTQTANWAAHPAPSTDQTEADATPFVITFERPRYICDFANGWTQRDEAHNTPPGAWDHRQGRWRSYIFHNNISTNYYSDGKSYNKLDRYLINIKIAGNFMDYNIWQLNDITGLLHNTYLSTDLRFAHGTAYISHNGYHHIAEQAITHTWRDTGGLVGVIVDTGNVGAPIPFGVADDIYIPGSVEVKAGDIVGMGGTTAPDDTYSGYFVDNAEPYFGTPGGLPLGFYTRITVYPQVPLHAAQQGQKFWVLQSTRRTGRWIRYDSDWANMVVLHNCVVDTSRDADGQLFPRLDSNAPAGKQYTIAADDTGICKIILDGASLTLPTVVLYNKTRLRTIAVDPKSVPPVYSIPDNQQLCYYSERCGANQDETWIIFNPQMAGVNIWVAAQFYGDDYWISDFWEQDGDIYAMEEGTGLILKYDGSTVTVHQDLGRGQGGGNALAIQQDTNNLWLTTAPSGFLARFSQQHSGHIDKLPLQLGYPDALGAIAKACDARVFMTGAGKLKFIGNQGFALSPTEYDKYSVRAPYPVVSCGIETENIRIAYDGGVAQATKDMRYRQIDLVCVQTYAHANKICVDYYNRGGKGNIEIAVPLIEFSNELSEEISVPMPDVPWRLGGKQSSGRIINYEKDLQRQVAAVNARRS